MHLEDLLLDVALVAERSHALLHEARRTPGFTPSGFSVTGGMPHETGHPELGDRLSMLKAREALAASHEGVGTVAAFSRSLRLAADSMALARDISACFDAELRPMNPAVHAGDEMVEAVRLWREAYPPR